MRAVAAWARWIFLGWWRTPPVPVESASIVEAPVATIIEPRVEPRSPRIVEDRAGSSEFFFKDQILERLSRYFKILERMKRVDREAFVIYGRVGAMILPKSGIDLIYGPQFEQLDSIWREKRPAFGMVVLSAEAGWAAHQNDKQMVIAAVHFRKFKATHAPSIVQPTNQAEIYVLTIYWDEPDEKKRAAGYTSNFAVAIDGDLNVRVLKVLRTTPVTLLSKRPGENGNRRFTIPDRRWRIDEISASWAAEHNIDPQRYLASVFCFCANTISRAGLGAVQVRVVRGAMSALFNVDMLRTPYFFRDRDVTVLVNGKRKSIFHAVRTHARFLPSGGETSVRMHFRGQRHFPWNGFAVTITVPGWHHKRMSDFEAPALDKNALSASDNKTVAATQVAKKMRDAEAVARPSPALGGAL